jgi:septal ring factor EnvC (AmiA/AmiB activator)
MSKKSAHTNWILCSKPYSRALCCAMARRSADISTAMTCVHQDVQDVRRRQVRQKKGRLSLKAHITKQSNDLHDA